MNHAVPRAPVVQLQHALSIQPKPVGIVAQHATHLHRHTLVEVAALESFQHVGPYAKLPHRFVERAVEVFAIFAQVTAECEVIHR